jgi:tRNA U34 5-carboxymethylaminomethyl modifying GTPase MnmE/TrmE
MTLKADGPPVTDLTSLLDLADLAVARSEGVLDECDRARLAATTSRLRSRGGYVGDVVVVALAGGTGSGKSSIINALVSEPVAPVGVVRPTTRGATAVIPADSTKDFGRLLLALGVENVVRSDALSSTILVDLPDFDSVEDAHRHIVDRVLPAVDAVLWVFDPEKYADRIVHEEFLSPMAAYADQFMFILNQVDQLGDDVEAVSNDLESRLTQDGYHEPAIVQCIASGDVQVDEVAAAVDDRFDTKTTALAKAALDLRLAANEAWQQSLKRPGSEPDIEAYEQALAQATLVSLGVGAYDYWHSITNGTRC